jgi:hypothetical protein
MKSFQKTILGTAFFCLMIFVVACNKDNNKMQPAYQNAALDAAKLTKLFDKQGAKTELFPMDAQRGGTIVTAQGTTFKVPADAFVNAENRLVEGEVTIIVKEIHKVSDMIFGNKATTTNKGEILTSFGEFFIGAEQKGQKLELAVGEGILASRPFKSTNGIIKSQVANWVGDISSGRKGVEWLPMPNLNNNFSFNRDEKDLTMLIQSLAWCNWDKLNADAAPKGRTTVSVLFESNFNDKTNGEASKEEVMLSSVFFKPSEQNSLYKFYELVEKSELSGLRVCQAYGDIVPIGMTGTLLAYSFIDGRIYAEVKEVVIGEGKEGGFVTSVNPKEVSEEDFIKMVESLDKN